MTDLVDVHTARRNLRQAYEAVQATSVQGKPAILGSIDQADDILVRLLEKGAARAVRFGGKGAFKRVHVPTELFELLMQMAPAETAKLQEA